MGLLRKIQDTRLYRAAYIAGHDVKFHKGYLHGWKTGNDEGIAEGAA